NLAGRPQQRQRLQNRPQPNSNCEASARQEHLRNHDSRRPKPSGEKNARQRGPQGARTDAYQTRAVDAGQTTTWPLPRTDDEGSEGAEGIGGTERGEGGS